MRLPRVNVIVLSVIFVIFFIIILVPMPWDNVVDDMSADLLMKMRGSRKVSEDIVFIYLSDDDIRDLGGWPITRDFYGYLIYILKRTNARAVGLYALFDSPDRRYPEYDRQLSDFIESSGLVGLPATIGEFDDLKRSLSENRTIPSGVAVSKSILYPIPAFRNAAAGIGFSNLGNDSVLRKVPLVVATPDSHIVSFGTELARLHYGPGATIRTGRKSIRIVSASGKHIVIPIDRYGRMRLNHFGRLDRVCSIGFLELMQKYESEPDSIDFSDKLVIVDVANPSIPVVRATPLAKALPASLIHATVAENILSQTMISESPDWIKCVSVLFILLAISFLWKMKNIRIILLSTVMILFLYLMISLAVFSFGHFIFPVVYPFIVCFVTTGYCVWTHNRNIRIQYAYESQALQAQIEKKHRQLEEAETRLVELDQQLGAEIEEKKVLSKESKKLAEEKRTAIYELEKHVRDLEESRVSKVYTSKKQYQEIVHDSDSKMVAILELIEKMGSDDIPVLIQGETGTGKELIARIIHRMSGRKKSSFVAINCGALPDTLLESELFGHEKGSFTGAHSMRRGRFELADGGTIFLDEITETTPQFQARLLRVLQEKTFERIGGEKSIRVNVRIIAATNKDLKMEVGHGIFREDLFYRLNGFPLQLPPLRERQNDIPLLADHFLKKHGYHTVSSISSRSMEILKMYRWPGNVRELENVVRRAAILAGSDGRNMIKESDIPEEIRYTEIEPIKGFVYQSFEEQILFLLRQLKFSRSAINQTARALDNRDRGTITEYFRGICFKMLVESDYSIDIAARSISASDDMETIERVKTKIREYLKNLRSSAENVKETDDKASYIKGLPQKYHTYIKQILGNFDRFF